MRILAIDTALGACAAAVYDSERGESIAEESLTIARGHAEELMPLVARVMDRAALEFLALDRIAVTVGPGSFTGLRVGIAAARGIALVAGRPAVGVSTLSAYAAPQITIDRAETTVAAIDARHGHVYCQVFGPGGRTLVAPCHIRIEEAVALAEGPAHIVGSAAALLAANWPPGEPPVVATPQPAPEIGWVARLGAAAQLGAAPKPMYLRPADAKPQDAARLPRR